MAERQHTNRYIFPRWANYLLPLLVIVTIGGAPYVTVLVNYGLSAKTLNVGYEPSQPVPYSHELHVGQLGIDCRYCHTTVFDEAFAAIPPTSTCINCHSNQMGVNGVKKKSPKLVDVYESYATGLPVEWVKVHNLPDYVYFNHAAHVNKGVSCVSCHGRVDKMPVVRTVEPLSMGWCLECHRSPEKHLRPVEEVTNLGWKPSMLAGETQEEAQLRVGTELKAKYEIHNKAYMTSCSTCHR